MLAIKQNILIVACTLAVITLSNWQIDFSLQQAPQSPPGKAPDRVSVAEIIIATEPANLRVDVESELPNLLPDFASQPIHLRKSEFVAYVIPFVEEENLKVSSIRQQLQGMQLSEVRTDAEIDWLQQLGRKYRVATDAIDQTFMSQLLLRIDQLPPSLVLAQAAIESAWGTSRFAQKANNLFGHWCMTPGCGIVPKDRPEYASYEIRKFGSVQQAVHRYFMNLNTNKAYAELREIRACHRSEGESLSGPVMAGGLLAYSGRGMDYIHSLRTLIRVNEWDVMDGNANTMFTSGCYAVADQLVSLEISSTEFQIASSE